MKNLRELPEKIYFSNVLSDLYELDNTSVLNIDNKNYYNITIPVSILEDNQNKSIVNRFVPFQNDDTYNAFYQYYNYVDNTIKAKSSIKNNYPIESQYPEDHESQVSFDGTITIDMKSYNVDDLNLSLYQKYNTVPKEQQDDSLQDFIITLLNLKTAEVSNGYKIVNSTTYDDHNILANTSYQNNKYGLYSYPDLYNPISLYNITPGYYKPYTDVTLLSKEISKQENEGLYVYYKLIDTKEIIQNNDIFEQEIRYDFNEKHWINVIKGYLYNFEQYGYDEERIKSDDRKYYGTQTALHCNTEYFRNDYSVDLNHYDEVILTFYYYNDIINEQEPIGYRSLLSPDVIDLEKFLPIKPVYAKSVKLVIQQKQPFKGIEDGNSTTIPDIVYKNVNGSVENKIGGADMNTNTLQFKRCAACSKFLPGFDIDLISNNKSVYHTNYDTISFVRFKDYETYIPSTTFITERLSIKNIHYYPYLENVIFNSGNLKFDINLNNYKHSDVLAGGIESIDLKLLTYDYNNIKEYNDATIVETYTEFNIDEKIQVDFTTNYDENYFIDFQINYNQNIPNIIDRISKLNYYTDIYNNYEYNFKVPQLNNISVIKKIQSYEYMADSTDIQIITKYDTNYIFINKNITEIEIDNTSNIDKVFIQINEISNDNLINEKYFDGTNYIDIFDSTSFYSLTNGNNIITFTDFTANENTDYILIFITNDNMEWNKFFNYNNTAKFNISYSVPIKVNIYDILTNQEAITTLQNNNIMTYKMQYTKKV